MYSLLRCLFMVLVSTGVWMVIGLGVGFVLHRVVPAIDLGIATLIAGGAWWQLAVAEPDFDLGGALRTR